MKKARLMLTAFIVFAFVGSALAFKAKDAYGRFIYKCPNLGTPANTVVLNYTLDVISGVPTIIGFYTTNQTSFCPLTTAYQQN